MKTIIHSLLVLALLTVGSCTVEKRLYNKGYNVSWNKKFRAEKSENNIDQSTVYSSDGPTEKKNPEIIPVQQNSIPDSPSGNQQLKTQTTDIQQEKSQEITASASEHSHSTVKNTHSKKGVIAHIQKWKEQKVSKMMRSERSSNGKAVLLLINALIFALLGLVFVTWFGTFGLIFGTIFYIAAGILLIFSIIYFILP